MVAPRTSLVSKLETALLGQTFHTLRPFGYDCFPKYFRLTFSSFSFSNSSWDFPFSPCFKLFAVIILLPFMHVITIQVQYLWWHFTPEMYLVVTRNSHMISRPLLQSCLVEELDSFSPCNKLPYDLWNTNNHRYIGTTNHIGKSVSLIMAWASQHLLAHARFRGFRRQQC